MKQGTAKLTTQDATAIRLIIERMESHIFDLNRLVTEGYRSERGITSTVSDIADGITGGHSYLPTTYRPLAGLKSERWDEDGNSASVSGGDVSTAEEHLDAILSELHDGTYPGFKSEEDDRERDDLGRPVSTRSKTEFSPRTGEDTIRDAAAFDAAYGVTICRDDHLCECPRCRPGNPEDFLSPGELATLEAEFNESESTPSVR